ncbi:hypothetical protein BMT54_10730 [Pasteurellaceae bacterium 15-036681]|nr:hypothetical protein BMT54_10730 [Pasteurellaceae bacterium 15-036681]
MIYSESKTQQAITSTALNKIHAQETLCDFRILVNRDDNESTEAQFIPSSYQVIDMDKLEANIASFYRRKKRKSMDCSFIVENNTSIYTVLVELRLNYTELANLKLTALKQKVKNSSAQAKLFGYPIYNELYFIFRNNIKQQAINRLNRMVPKCPSHYEVKTVEEMVEMFFTN